MKEWITSTLCFLLLLSTSFAAQVQTVSLSQEEVIVYKVEPVNVDATMPSSTQVRYSIYPAEAVLPSVKFIAPGVTAEATNVSNSVWFIINQRSLALDKNLIRLTIDDYQTDITATRTEKIGPQISEAAIVVLPTNPGEPQFPISIKHKLTEIRDIFEYSVPTTPGSRTILVGRSISIIETPNNGEIPEFHGWIEKHFYQDINGSYLRQTMPDPTGPTLPDQSGHHLSKRSSDDSSFGVGKGLKGVAEIDFLTFKGDGGIVFPLGPIINAEVDAPIE